MRRGHFEFSTMFILYLCTQLGNEFLVTFYTPRNSNASADGHPKLHSHINLKQLQLQIILTERDLILFSIS